MSCFSREKKNTLASNPSWFKCFVWNTYSLFRENSEHIINLSTYNKTTYFLSGLKQALLLQRTLMNSCKDTQNGKNQTINQSNFDVLCSSSKSALLFEEKLTICCILFILFFIFSSDARTEGRKTLNMKSYTALEFSFYFGCTLSGFLFHLAKVCCRVIDFSY